MGIVGQTSDVSGVCPRARTCHSACLTPHRDGASYGREPWQGGVPVIWARGGGLLRVVLASGGAWMRPKPVEVVPERMAGRRWSDWPPDEDEGCGVALGGLGGSRRSRRRAPVSGHTVVLASNVRERGTHVGGLRSVRDTSQDCDMPGCVVPCRDDMALVSDGLRAARPASDGLEGVSEARTHHLACGMATETSRGIGGHRCILTMAMRPWRPCLTCVDPPLHMPEAHSSHSDASRIVMRHGHVY